MTIEWISKEVSGTTRQSTVDIKLKPYPEVPIIDERMIHPEVTICAHFSCNRQLSLHEKLCGKYCILHQNIKPIDPTKWISH